MELSGWLTSRPGRFTPGQKPRYPPNRKLGGPQGRSGRFKEEKNLLLLPAFVPRTFQPSHYTDFSIPAWK